MPIFAPFFALQRWDNGKKKREGSTSFVLPSLQNCVP